MSNASFKLLQLFFPKMECHFVKSPSSVNYVQGHRISLTILDNKSIILLFGVSLQSDERENNVPVIGAIVEVAARIELPSDIGIVNRVADLPLSANMLALLFPFLREKVNYFFSNNHVNVLLNPINTIDLIKDPAADQLFTISDLRKKEAVIES